MDEQQVEIALWGEFAAAVPAGRQQGNPSGRALGAGDRVVEERHDPVVGELRKRPAVVTPGTIDGVGDTAEMPRSNR